MSEHHLTLDWRRATSDFNYDTFERTHAIHFSGGTRLEVSSAPDYLGNKAYTNPEELLGAALASCHMLTFLAIVIGAAGQVKKAHVKSAAEYAVLAAGGYPTRLFQKISEIADA